MTNPWDKQPRESRWLDNPGALPCPVCGEPTEHLKQYRFVAWMVFYLIGATYSTAYYRGCPRCVRRVIAKRAAWNVLPANLLWVALVLPWALVLIAASYRKGHSRDVLRNISPQEAALIETRRDAAANEVNWGRVLAICGALFCWAPVVGLPFAALAFWANYRATNWTRPVSAGALAVSLVVHALVAVLALGAARR
jgi:hypothetical protein